MAYEWSSEEEDEEYTRQVNESLGFDIDVNARFPESGIRPRFLGVGEPPYEITLYARLGVHCFNIEKGRNLQITRILKYNDQFIDIMSYYITVEVKDLADNSAYTFQTLVTYSSSWNDEDLRVFVEICRIKSEIPESASCIWDERAIDEFYKGCMPKFLLDDTLLEADDKLRFYEVSGADIHENDWLHLYTEFALFYICRFNKVRFEPVDIKKIVVETHEAHTEPRRKLKSSNAIFYINFSANTGEGGSSDNYRTVIRKTKDGKTGHMVLELSCWLHQP